MINNNILLGLLVLFVLYLLFNKKNNAVEGYLDFPGVYWPLDYKYGESNVGSIKSVDMNPNTVFSAHPNKLVCSFDQNEWTKHIRLHHSGGVMYTSNNPPSEVPSCKQVTCPPLVKDLNTLKERDHFNPYPLRKDKLKCWQCIDKY